MNQEQIEQDYQEALRRIREAKDTLATSLDLSGLIWDRLPPELFDLTWLEELALQQSGEFWEEPRGTIPLLPQEFSRLLGLRHLNMSKLGVQNLVQLAALKQLTTLDCGRNQLTDLAPLAALPQLTSLDCGRNQLTDLAPLAALPQLTSLACGGNQLTDLAPLAALTQLTSLHCERNQLTDLAPLATLTQLTSLDCGYNQLTDLAVIKPAVLNGQIQTLKVFNIPVVGIPHELLGTREFDNVASTLREYWLDMAQGSAPNRDVKVLLVGNGCVGKSTLAHGLRMGAPPPVPIDQRTHAIEIDTLETPLASDGPTLRWHLWDFGGQELYHATHRLFLHHQAVFLLLWAEETDETPDEVRHPVSYWLNFIQDLSSGSPVLLVKNQIDRWTKCPARPICLKDLLRFIKS